jgi:hypothetical protein
VAQVGEVAQLTTQVVVAVVQVVAVVTIPVFKVKLLVARHQVAVMVVLDEQATSPDLG